MKIEDFAINLLFGEKITDKLFYPDQDILINESKKTFLIPETPGRSQKFKFSNKQLKFPKQGTLSIDENRGKALHFFANHELLAIEMMAAVLLKFPTENTETKKLKNEILFTIKDEQKHLSLYIKRMNDFGVEFGDYPLNDFFWKQVNNMHSFSDYLAIMSLTFEAANLDFAKTYQKIFSQFDDTQSAKIMGIVFHDEIKHVHLGVEWLNKWRSSKTLWQYYIDHLPGFLTPKRSMGINFSIENRLNAGFDMDFVESLIHYEDNFAITNRKKL